MPSIVPVYKIQAFARHEPDALFFMTRLEKLVQEFKGIDKPHSHAFYLVMWLEQGSGTHTIDFKTYDIAANQLYFLTPGQVHSWSLSADTKGINLYIDANFFRSRFGNRLQEYLFFHSHQHVPLLEIDEESPRFTTLFGLAYDEYKQRRVNWAEILRSYVHILLEMANRLYNQQWVSADTHLYDRIRQYEELIEQQFLTVREVSAYAEQMNVTPNHLNFICKQVLRKTASQLLYERIVVEAQRLLTHSTQSVKEIGFQLGFDDPSYFVRFFKKHAQLTPAEFRQSLVLYP